MNRAEVRALTGLRGVAAVLIAAYHFIGSGVLGVSSFYLGVDLFFILSGYVLAYNYPNVFSFLISARSFGDFLYKRIARIYPAYLFFTSIYIIKLILNIHNSQASASFLTAKNIIGNAALLTSWGLGITPIVQPSWSISAEMFCYLLFPFLMLALARRPRATGIVMLAGSCLGLLAVSLSGFGVSGDLDVFGGVLSLLRALAGFSIGILLCRFCRRCRSRKIGGASFVAALVVLVFAGIMGLGDLWKVPALVMLVHAASTDNQVTTLILGNRPIHYLGRISYSFYLAHAAFIGPFSMVARKLDGHVGMGAANAIAFLLYVGALVAVASVTYPLIEIRGKKLILRMLRRYPSRDRVEASHTLSPSTDFTPGPK